MTTTNSNDLGHDVEKGVMIPPDGPRNVVPATPTSGTTCVENSDNNHILHWNFQVPKWLLTRPFRRESNTCQTGKNVPDRGLARETIVRKIEETPDGFPRLAAFLDSDDNFMLYRRFGYIHARILLNKQDQLREIEEDLRLMDEEDDSQAAASRRCLRSRVKDEKRARNLPAGTESRGQLLRRAEDTVKEYGQLLLQAQQLVAMNRPSRPDYNSVRYYIEGRRPLFHREEEFIYQREDLVTLRPGRECAWLDAFIERVLRAIRCETIVKIFCSEEVRRKTQDPEICYFSRSRISILCTVLITLFILILLVVPIYALYEVSSSSESAESSRRSDATCIGVLIVSALVFSVILSLFTKARRHEILGASAAYCAVLVVFISVKGS